MAALTLVLAALGASASMAFSGEPTSVKRKVALSLKFDGLSPQGGEVEIKPGNAGSKFETIKFQTKGHPKATNDGRINLDPFEVETFTADRDCSFAITLKEPGLPDKTVRRVLKITAATEPKTAQPLSMNCFISSTSLAEKTDDTKRKK